MRGAAFAVFLSVAALLPGCAPVPGPLPPVSPQELLYDVFSTPGANAVQARGDIQVSTPDGGYRGSILLFYRHPDSLKVLIQAGLGTTIAELALTGPNGIAYLPQQRQAFELTPGSALLVGNATMYPSLLTHLMNSVESEHFGDSVSVLIAGRSYYLRGDSPGGLRTWKINGRSRDLEAEDFISAEHTVEWHRTFKVIRDRRVPHHISVQLGDTKTVVTLTRIDVAPEWRGNPFRVRLPSDVEVISPDRD